MDENVGSVISTLADDTQIGVVDKSGRLSNNTVGYRSVGNFGGETAEEFDLCKCEVLHFERSNVRGKYTVNAGCSDVLIYRTILGYVN